MPETTCDRARPRYARTRPTWRMNRIELAKAYAEAMGFHTHRSGGGWLYSRTDTPIAQGWDTFATKLERRGIIRVGVGIVWPR